MGSSPKEAKASENTSSKPPGIRFIEHIRTSTVVTFKTYQVTVLAITFLTYACYHATRKTPSIVKNALILEAPALNSILDGSPPWPRKPLSFRSEKDRHISSLIVDNGWAPFNGSATILGQIDLAFLSFYSFGMYFAGHLGDQLDLRLFLTVGMLGTGLSTLLFGFGYWLNIHSFYYFLTIQMLAGLFQSTGWPSVVAVVGNWFGKKKRGLIMGLWNAHTSIGNILGSLIASALLDYGWGWSFAVPALMISFMGLVVFLLLPVSPESVGADRDHDELKSHEKSNAEVAEPLLGSGSKVVKENVVGFIAAWKIPGVASYAMCLFFSKLVAYTFLYWLPFYISCTAIHGKYLSDEAAGNLSTLFDVGGVLGGVLAGHISDRLDARAITAASFVYCSIPALYLYRSYGETSLFLNVALMIITGVFVNGPYALITTAVSIDLGTQRSLNGNSRALATVTAIIDGTGSVGAAIGPLLTGYISAKSWNAVFTMLMIAALVAGLLLTRLVLAEITSMINLTSSQASSPIRPSTAIEV
ncbi:hypothetical protein Scep_026911 [Stephania cephalantha]|uniref:Major facilitator superfamily (MFS) profile domain-containing protein n=1 Tax=Stephania cephalantha TaxID=152367 RepID=A0AAP0HSF8_9MAGN